MIHLLRTIQGGLLRTGGHNTYLVTGCVIKATIPPTWSYAVLKARGFEMVLSHPTPYDHQQAYRVDLAPAPDVNDDVAVIVNQQIVYQAPRLYEFKMQLFGATSASLDPVRMFSYTLCASRHENALRN